MKLRGFVAEDFCNYKRPSMFIASAVCDWKCCTEAGHSVALCQNSPLMQSPIRDISDETLVKMYLSNPITTAIVVGGLEPMLQFDELYHLLSLLRADDAESPFVIYTGYYPEEIKDKLDALRGKHVIVKFGRYIPNRPTRYDDLLGVTLASDNQFARAL